MEAYAQPSTVAYFEWGTNTDYGNQSTVFNVGPQTALNLTGTNQNVSLVNAAISSSFTIEAWVYLRSKDTPACLLDITNIFGRITVSLVSSNGNPQYSYTMRNGTSETLVAPTALPLNQWVHFAFASTSQSVRIFTNGVQAAVSTEGYSDGSEFVTGFIGRYFQGGGGQFNGAVDEFRIWDVARTSDQLIDGMKKILSTSTLKIFERYEEGSGTTAKSSGSSSLSGTLQGGASWTNGVAMTYSFTATNLNPAITYHYRLVTINDAGMDAGPDQTFTTFSNAPTVVTLAPTNLTHTSGRLQGTIDPNGLASTPSFEYGATTNYGNIISLPQVDAGSDPVLVSAVLSGLAPGASIHYRLKGTNVLSGATIARGVDRILQTFPLPTASAIIVTTNNQLQLQFTGGAGLSYTLQSSSNLINWIDLTNGMADPSGGIQFMDFDAANISNRFYRLRYP